ncbi:hypothetical protein M422DRAFT_234240 [Sphaerobolus stellatus SS14]|uniref:Uncharacterized protein n=1 Tax=Sphaerobolus stellatus (strain SS14) TaxID=990650 RepID=A0A0C9UCB0_SPHS4|nr:hypothetical protein M422DRAFT_234240 [Sphaerobolus stellatus SS14]
MHPTFRSLAGHVHKPLIRFLGKRTPPSGTHTPHAHPAAPPEIASHFDEFLKRMQSSAATVTAAASSSSKTEGGVSKKTYAEFWEAPSRYWQPMREIEDKEIDAVLTGGASLR